MKQLFAIRYCRAYDKISSAYSKGLINFSQMKKKMQRLNRHILSAIMIVLCFVSNAYARDIDTIIVHHTDLVDVDRSAAEIDRYHLDRGWDEIGYHYIIRRDGSIEFGRDDEKQGAHASGRNANSIGVALSGNNATQWQIEALYKLLRKLRNDYQVTSIERHHEKCPGSSINIEQLEEALLGRSE